MILKNINNSTIEFEDQLQLIDDLISRARHYAQTNRSYSLEVILHLLDHAHHFNDSALFDVCHELMALVNSPSPYPLLQDIQQADDKNNRQKSAIEATPTELPYDNSLDDIFDKRVNTQSLKIKLDSMTFNKKSRVHWYVVYQVLLHLKWLKEDCQQKAFLQWVNLQYHCGWTKNIDLAFSRDVNKSMRDVNVSLWNTIDKSIYTKGQTYYNFAVLLRNTFEKVIVNGKEQKEPAKDFITGKNRDRTEFMACPGQLINWGK